MNTLVMSKSFPHSTLKTLSRFSEPAIKDGLMNLMTTSIHSFTFLTHSTSITKHPLRLRLDTACPEHAVWPAVGVSVGSSSRSTHCGSPGVEAEGRWREVISKPRPHR